jgi:hypothetical protein
MCGNYSVLFGLSGICSIYYIVMWQEGTSMDKEIWALAGIVIGVLLKGLFDYIQDARKKKIADETWARDNQGANNVKSLLISMLWNRKHIDRSFDALKAKIGGYTDDQIRRFLVDVGAQKVRGRSDGKEYWFLTERNQERNERRNGTAK